MNDPLFHLSFGSLEVVVTAWKLIGYLGLLLFTGRWVVQLIASRRAGMPGSILLVVALELQEVVIPAQCG